MHSGRTLAAEAVAGRPAGRCVLVLLSERLGELRPGLDLPAIREWLERELQWVRAEVVSDVRREPARIAEMAEASGAERVAMGLATGEYAAAQVQAQVRKAGVDPLGVEVVNLEAHAAVLGSRSVASERAKVLLAGAVARVRAFPGSRQEHLKTSLSVAMSRRALFTMSLHEYRAVPAILAERCAAERGCQLCVRTCPRGALRVRDGRVELDKARCESCGLCLEACPSGALELPGYTPAELEARLGALLDPAMGELWPRGVLFACQQTMATLEAAVERGFRYPDGWLPVAVPCAGMLSPTWLLGGLAMGAARVGVMACGGQCPFRQDDAAAERVAFCQELLREMGGAPERVTLCPLEPWDQATWALPDESRAWLPVYRASEMPDGERVGAKAVLALALAHQAQPGLVLDHPASPFGVIELDAEGCTGCEGCASICPTGALSAQRESAGLTITFEGGLCTACELCVPRCPEIGRGVLRVRRAVDLGVLRAGPTVVYRDEVQRCVACGQPVASAAMVGRIADLLGDDWQALGQTIAGYCSECRSDGLVRPRNGAGD